MAFVFGNADDELYPFLGDEGSDVPLSPDDQALLMGMYPGANLTDFDFALINPNGVIQQHHAPQAHVDADATAHRKAVTPNSIHTPPAPTVNLSIDTSAERSKMPGLVQPTFYDPNVYHQPQDQRGFSASAFHMQKHASSGHGHGVASPNGYSPSSTQDSDSGMRDSEEILKAPVKSLNEEEKKLRRRAQVAKSARKHRNRQKEELSRLREQVLYLQEQMAAMKVNGSAAVTPVSAHANVDMNQDNALAMQRKRKKVEDTKVTLETALTDQSTFASAAQRMLENSMVASTMIQHGFHRLSVDTLDRTKLLQAIATKRSQYARQYLYNEFGSRIIQYPIMDIKLNQNGPDMEIKLVRAKKLPGFTHLEVADAAWNSIYNFDLAIPPRFKRYVTCEKLMELDDNTRYGRTIAPLLKNREENFVVYMHSYFVLHKVVYEDCVIITWESIAMDELYPFEASDTAIRNDEVGCTILETETLPNGDVNTLHRTVIHSQPPVAAITEPRGRLNEAFLTVFCRSADILETSARLYLQNKYPGRTVKAEFEYVHDSSN